jgi:hypothetical protein
VVFICLAELYRGSKSGTILYFKITKVLVVIENRTRSYCVRIAAELLRGTVRKKCLHFFLEYMTAITMNLHG